MRAMTTAPAMPHVSRELTARIARAYGLTFTESRQWFRRPCPELGGTTPAHLAASLEGIRELTAFLELKATERSRIARGL